MGANYIVVPHSNTEHNILHLVTVIKKSCNNQKRKSARMSKLSDQNFNECQIKYNLTQWIETGSKHQDLSRSNAFISLRYFWLLQQLSSSIRSAGRLGSMYTAPIDEVMITRFTCATEHAFKTFSVPSTAGLIICNWSIKSGNRSCQNQWFKL